VAAVKSLRRQPPEGAPAEDHDLGRRAHATILDVMTGGGNPKLAYPRLVAARMILDEVCGPMVRQFAMADPHGIVERLQAGRERAAQWALEDERREKRALARGVRRGGSPENA
jgi:hypothetical protein